MIIYFNKPLVFNGQGDIWVADNGEKKTNNSQQNEL